MSRLETGCLYNPWQGRIRARPGVCNNRQAGLLIYGVHVGDVPHLIYVVVLDDAEDIDPKISLSKKLSKLYRILDNSRQDTALVLECTFPLEASQNFLCGFQHRFSAPDVA